MTLDHLREIALIQISQSQRNAVMTKHRYLVDTTKAAMAAYPGFHVIVDSHRPATKGEASVKGVAVVALCPITNGPAPICEGQFSFAPLVQRALEQAVS